MYGDRPKQTSVPVCHNYGMSSEGRIWRTKSHMFPMWVVGHRANACPSLNFGKIATQEESITIVEDRAISTEKQSPYDPRMSQPMTGKGSRCNKKACNKKLQCWRLTGNLARRLIRSVKK